MLDSFYIDLAVNEAWKYWGLTYPNPPVGGLLLDRNGAIVSISAHQRAGSPHSEVLLFQNAFWKLTKDREVLNLSDSQDIHNFLYENHKGIFKDFTLYTTLEPCNHFGKTPPCSLLIRNLGIKRVVIGTLDTNPTASGGVQYLQSSGIEVDILNSPKAKYLVEPFEQWSKGQFIFFKYAQRLDGSIDGGTISSLESRKYIHSIRDRIDLMVIGGETIRTDRPTLDSRLVGGSAPDILIYSKYGEFDKTIPLFSVPDRNVYIDSSLERIENYRFIMVEGGYNLLQAILEYIDWVMVIISPTLSTSSTIHNLNIQFQIIHYLQIGEDIILWLRKKSPSTNY